jgi:hypothetical protein
VVNRGKAAGQSEGVMETYRCSSHQSDVACHRGQGSREGERLKVNAVWLRVAGVPGTMAIGDGSRAAKEDEVELALLADLCAVREPLEFHDTVRPDIRMTRTGWMAIRPSQYQAEPHGAYESAHCTGICRG